MITVDYPSNKLLKTLERCELNIYAQFAKTKKDIENRFKSKSRFWQWFTDHDEDDVTYVEKSKNWKLDTLNSLRLAANSGDYVRLSMDALKWIDHHDNDNEFGW